MVAVRLWPTGCGARIRVRRGATLDRPRSAYKSNSGNIMATTFTCLQYHLVFSTKNREPWLRSDVQDRVWAYLGGIAWQKGLKPLLIGGVDEHIHMLVGKHR